MPAGSAHHRISRSAIVTNMASHQARHARRALPQPDVIHAAIQAVSLSCYNMFVMHIMERAIDGHVAFQELYARCLATLRYLAPL